ncbi:MAG TPA: PfkB family carbohydrate kinase [Polyangia bacterium]|jgi:hydroxymethylpyrimidine/phosphomethylpyrimidine kinase
MDPARPVLVIAVAGVDQSGGAGLVRDVLTGAALGVGVACVGTAWTEQEAGNSRVSVAGSTGVLSVEPRAPAEVGAALGRALARHPNAAVKIGMVPDAAAAAAIVGALDGAGFVGPVVVDPVLAASAGGALWSGPLDGLWPLLRRATVVTPNAGEAARLSGKPVATADEAEAAAMALRARGITAVLVKGGHLDQTGAAVTDRLVDAAGVQRFSRPRVPGVSPRGTGCALSTAIAAALAAGATLPAAVEEAGRWLAGRIAASVVVGGQRFLP